MKYILLVLFFGVELAAAQSDSLLNHIALQINERLAGSRLRGRLLTYSVSVNDGAVQLESGDQDSARLKVLKELLSPYRDSLFQGSEKYNSSIYCDAYSGQVYTALYTPPTFSEGVFADYPELLPDPDGTTPRQLINTIYDDLNKHREQLDSLFIGVWFSPLTLFIDTLGTARPIPPGPLSPYLDSTLRIRWRPGVHHGHLMNALVSIQVDRGRALSDRSKDRTWCDDANLRFSYLLPDTYGGRFVRFEEERRNATGKTVVSFIFNPATLLLEHPLVHEGATDDADKFITWLSKRSWQSDLFYWKDYPCAARSYFCLD